MISFQNFNILMSFHHISYISQTMIYKEFSSMKR